jgi:Helix-turn-helix domain
MARLLRKDPRTMQRWCRQGKLPGAYKAGRSWRIPPAALREAKLAAALSPTTSSGRSTPPSGYASS